MFANDLRKADGIFPDCVCLLGSFGTFLRRIEVDNLPAEIRFPFFYTEFLLPKTPVLSGWGQISQYVKRKILINYNLFPVLVWHRDSTAFTKDLCFFRFNDLLALAESLGYRIKKTLFFMNLSVWRRAFSIVRSLMRWPYGPLI